MPQICKRIPMPERDFNKVAEQLGELWRVASGNQQKQFQKS